MASTSARRRGASLVESLILIIVVVMSLGAVFATINWGLRSYTAGRQDLESRQVLFTWYQTFESMWQPPVPPAPVLNAVQLEALAQAQIEAVGNILGTWNNGAANIRGYIVTAVPQVVQDRMLNVTITISSGNRVLVNNAERAFNIFIGASVADATGN